MKTIILSFFISLFMSSNSFAFVLMDPGYHLSNPEAVKVYLASGGCQGNGLTNSSMEDYINEAIKDYWNTVSESRLFMEYEGESSLSISSDAPGGAIIIGCQAFGASGASGIATINTSKDGCKVRLNATTFVPGGFYREGIMGTLIHEMGHCVGLHHSKDDASVMTYETTTFTQPKKLSRDDIDGVIYLYPNKSVAAAFGGCSAIAGPYDKSASAWDFFTMLFFVIVLTVYLRKGLNSSNRLFLKFRPRQK